MKLRFIFIYLLVINLVHAGNSEESFEEMKDTVQKVNTLSVVGTGPNSINYDCQQCITESDFLEAVSLDSEEVSLEKVLFAKGIRDNTFTIKRTEKTPDIVKINFKERFKVCKKTIAHKNPFSGEIGFSCSISVYELREESIEIDFSDRELESGTEYINVRLVKLASGNKGFINASFKDQAGRGISSSRGGKFLFFGTKYNLE